MEFVFHLLAGCETVPQKWHEPLYVPILFSLVAAGIYAAGKVVQTREGRAKPFRWTALLPLLIGLYSGFTTVSCLGDSFYRSQVADYGKRWMLGHIGAIAVPVIGFLVILVWEWMDKRNEFRN